MFVGVPLEKRLPSYVATVRGGVKWVIDHLNELLQHVIRGWSVGPVNCYLHHFVEREVIDVW